MKKSSIAIGQMFVHFDKAYMEFPKVWVKVENRTLGNHYGEDNEEVSLFVDNNALVKTAINPNYKPELTEKWNITDRYYKEMTRQGIFVPFNDLREVGDITKQLGCPDYVLDF